MLDRLVPSSLANISSNVLPIDVPKLDNGGGDGLLPGREKFVADLIEFAEGSLRVLARFAISGENDGRGGTSGV
jgi:hypothetical protein